MRHLGCVGCLPGAVMGDYWGVCGPLHLPSVLPGGVGGRSAEGGEEEGRGQRDVTDDTGGIRGGWGWGGVWWCGCLVWCSVGVVAWCGSEWVWLCGVVVMGYDCLVW